MSLSWKKGKAAAVIFEGNISSHIPNCSEISSNLELQGSSRTVFSPFSFGSSFDPFQKKRSGPKDKLEMDKMLHKVKRERKAAKKDLRKDSAFLAKQKAKEARLR